MTSPPRRTCQVLESQREKTCRLPRGPAGSPITPTQTPAVKQRLTRSLFSFPRSLASLSRCYAFILHHRTPPAPSPAIAFFTRSSPPLPPLLAPSFSEVLSPSPPPSTPSTTTPPLLSLFPRQRANLMLHSNSCHPLAFSSSDRRNAGRQVREKKDRFKKDRYWLKVGENGRAGSQKQTKRVRRVRTRKKSVFVF